MGVPRQKSEKKPPIAAKTDQPTHQPTNSEGDGRAHNGRPFKFGEPTVKREFRLPATMNQRLVELARQRGDDISDVLRDALNRELDSPTQLNQPTNSPTNQLTRDALKAALLELIPGLQTAADLGAEVAAARQTAHHKAVPLDAARRINANLQWAQTEAAREREGVQFLVPHISDARVVSVPLIDKIPCGPWKEAIDRAEVFVMSAELAAFVGYESGDFFALADGASMQEAGIPDGALILMRPLERSGRSLSPKDGEISLIEITTADGDCFSTVKHFYQTPTGAPDLRDGAGRPFYPPSDAKSVRVVAVKRGLLSRG